MPAGWCASGRLDYVRTLRDVGVREGEAPARADGALRLMTIHKAKGLEFPVVVLADASRKPGGRISPFYLKPETGLTFQVEGTDSQPLLYKTGESRLKSRRTKRRNCGCCMWQPPVPVNG